MTDPALLRGFSVFMRARLGLPYPLPPPSEPAVCLVRRSSNRRILNEDEVVAALSKFVRVEVVQFDALSYHEQVRWISTNRWAGRGCGFSNISV